jgi:queuine/archaeosine tRNA-ribosyltransferase
VSLHNLHFMNDVCGMIRRGIEEGDFLGAKKRFYDAYYSRPN